MRKRMAVLALGLVSVLFAGREAAADIPTTGPMASVEIDWTTLDIRTFDLGLGAPSYVLSNQHSESTVRVGANNVYDNAANWSPGTMSSSYSPLGFGYAASLNETVIKAEAGLDEMTAGNVSAWSEYGAVLTITGTGLLSVMVDYTWKVELVEGQEGNQYASAWCAIDLDSEDYSHGGRGYAFNYLTTPILDDVFVDEESGRLVAALYVTDGMVVHMTGGATANVSANPVPVPSALWLLGSGVFGLLVRKKKNLA